MQKRKELGPVYEKAKTDGNNPRFIMARLFIDGVEYTVPSYGCPEENLSFLSWNV